MAVKKKIVLVGDSAVGKTSLIRRFVFDQFEDTYIATIGSKVTMKELTIERPDKTHSLTFMIWDIIGREGYQGVQAKTFVGVNGAILVADMTRKETLRSLERHWIPFLFKVVDKVPLVFVCNKSDLTGEFEFQPEELADVAKRYNGNVSNVLQEGLEPSYSTSAKTGSNVEKAFGSLGHLVLCSEELADPIQELYESLVALGIHRSTDKTTAVGTLDSIIVDFCDGFEDSKVSMLVLRQELARASFDVNNPSKEGILRAVEYLAEAESEFKDESKVHENLRKRMEWVDRIKE
ncbi:MAG: GTP-binding protein [Thermoplasmata archaeon]|nr:MAG: GTP-binding protein [Thermoplasmata archaeon]